jgi:N-hydroxyarylamine O-acetyltransferase
MRHDFPLDAYLARIGWSAPADATPETLVALHRAHALAIPFENIDPFSGIPVSLEPAVLVEKMIHRRRGGYCFEQNGLFLAALRALGFRTRSLMARVQISDDCYGIRSHQITLVECGGTRWLADVGFGGNGLLEAIPFELECEFDQHLDRYRILPDADHGYRLEHRLADRWRALYAFSLDPFSDDDYAVVNYFISRSPDSTFTKIPICVRTLETERRLIVANEYKVRPAGGHATTTVISTAAELRATLTGPLGIPLPPDHDLPAPPARPAGLRDV